MKSGLDNNLSNSNINVNGVSRWRVSDPDRYVDGQLAFGPGIRCVLLSHSHAMYYSPSQWCSVGYVIHNWKLPNFKHISYEVMALRFISA